MVIASQALAAKPGTGNTLFAGTIQANPKGFGFAITETKSRYFVPPPQMANLITGDLVEFKVSVNPRNQKEQTNQLKLVSRPESFWLGVAAEIDGKWWLTTDEPMNPSVRLCIENPQNLPFAAGDVVQVRVAPGTVPAPVLATTLVANLGLRDRKGFDSDYAIARGRIPVAFQEAAQAEASALDQDILAYLANPGYKDFRALPFVTIDGASTRDYDDAVHVTPVEDHYMLRVAVADVAQYVTPGSALNQAAADRGTSVYLPDRVIPMLPSELSTGLCSLNPEEDRLALVCNILVSPDGEIKDYHFNQAVIRSSARLTYEEVAEVLENDLPHAHRQQLDLLKECYQALRQRREGDGVLEFDRKEPKPIVVDNEIVGMDWLELTIAHHLVEDCMLAANQCAADYLTRAGRFTLFRHHAAPQGEDWDETKLWLLEHGIAVPEVPCIQDFVRIQTDWQAHEDFPLVQERLRRCMSPATYCQQNSGHFSLGLARYTHFTSPIRRYPDLLVHRAIKALLLQDHATLDAMETVDVAHLGLTNHRARRAERYVWSKMKARFMRVVIGQTFAGKTVFGSARGLKVVLLDWDIPGWLPADQLTAGGFEWDEERALWVRERTMEPGRPLGVLLRDITQDGTGTDELLLGLALTEQLAGDAVVA